MNEQREALAEALLPVLMAEYGGDPEDWTGMRSLRRVTQALLDSPALARLLADAEQRGADRVTAAVEGAIRLVSPDHVTPMGARQLRAALTPAAAQDPA